MLGRFVRNKVFCVIYENCCKPFPSVSTPSRSIIETASTNPQHNIFFCICFHSSAGSAKTGESGKGNGLLPIPSHIYTGEPLYQCKIEAAAASLSLAPLLPPPSFSPLPPSLLAPDVLFPPTLYHHQGLEMGTAGIFNSYQYYQVWGGGDINTYPILAGRSLASPVKLCISW